MRRPLKHSAAFFITLGFVAGFAIVGAQLADAGERSPQKLSSKVIRAAKSPHAGEFVVAVNKSQVLEVDQAFDEISVGNSEIADVVPLTKRKIYVLGKKLGSTSLTLFAKGGRVIAIADLVIGHDVEGLKAKLHELMPDEPVEIHQANDSIVLSGQVSGADQLDRAVVLAQQYAPKKVTNLLRVGGSSQVMLEVRFAEVQRRTLKELGFTQLFQNGTFSFFSGLGVPLDAFTAGTLHIGDFDSTFDALEDKGLVTVLAEPNLIVLSGDTASFLAGGEFPIPIAQGGTGVGGVAITVEFKQFGVGLNFTPTVIGKELINLALKTEVSDIDPTISVTTDFIKIPGLRVRRAETTVELKDGQAFAIAGLIQDGMENAIQQFPWLGDVPVLGTLFRSTQFQRRQSELVVFIMPRLVQPADNKDMLVSPTDNVVVPSQSDLYLFGRQEGIPGSGPSFTLGTSSAGGIDGPHGYIIK
jgi:pilus assembly protein CpaC